MNKGIKMRIETNKKEAAQIILEGVEEGKLAFQAAGRKYFFSEELRPHARYHIDLGDGPCMCAIGYLFETKHEGAAEYLENKPNYSYVTGLLNDDFLVVPEGDYYWFIRVQELHDTIRVDEPYTINRFIDYLKEAANN